MVIFKKKKWLRKPLSVIQAENGNCFIAYSPVPGLSSHAGDLPAQVLEDGKPLPGPSNALHDDIRKKGQGRYSFWYGSVYFSTTDNTSPLTNHRVYEIMYPAEVESVVYVIKRLIKRVVRKFTHRNVVDDGTKPVNLQKRDYSLERIKADVEYAGSIGRNYLNWLRDNGHDIKGKTILEIGPGINFGSTLLLACFGAKVAVVDRFLAPWDADYHGDFYKLFQRWIEENFPEADSSPIEVIRATKGYSPNVINCYQTPLEELQGIQDSSIDVIISNAVFEHLFHPERSFFQLGRVSKPGAIGYHQVDFRDHSDFSKPLEFLLVDDDEFKEEMARNHCERGNRYRPTEYRDLFVKNGFEVIKFQPNIFPDDDYLTDFMTRLAAMGHSKYVGLAREELRNVSGYFVVRKA